MISMVCASPPSRCRPRPCLMAPPGVYFPLIRYPSFALRETFVSAPALRHRLLPAAEGGGRGVGWPGKMPSIRHHHPETLAVSQCGQTRRLVRSS